MTPSSALRLPRRARVRARAQFDRVFEHGRRVSHPLLALHWAPAREGEARLGLAVSRKVDPRAVHRNRIKRVLRELFRHQRARLAPGDYVLVARPAARTADADTLRATCLQLLRRAGALPPEPAAGTMPRASPVAADPTTSLPDTAPDSGPR